MFSQAYEHTSQVVAWCKQERWHLGLLHNTRTTDKRSQSTWWHCLWLLIMLVTVNLTLTLSRSLTRLTVLDCAQAVQTFTKLSNVNQSSSGIWIQISRLLSIRIQTSAGSLPKCCGFITLSASVISPSVVKISQWLWEMLINLLKSIITQRWGKQKMIQNPYPGPDHHQKLISSSD